MRRTIAAAPGILLTVAVFLIAHAGTAQAGPPVVDFRYSPATHMTAICFPCDWQKTVVTERGSLGYDFGPGPYARPLTEIRLGAKEIPLSPEQPRIANPRVPIVSLRLDGNGASALVEEFAVAPGRVSPPSSSFLSGKVRRLGGLTGTAGWAAPPPSCDPAFRNAA
ncbi:MAG TPA: hypothetical protein VK569_09050, partial [Bacteroidota bacterium]|nr:hypothetical protein [Bacteroidota bacterium]